MGATDKYAGPAVTWADVWELWAEVATSHGCEVRMNLWAPRSLADGTIQHAKVSVTGERLFGKELKSYTRSAQIGGYSGYKNAAAAAQWALYHLKEVLEEAGWTARR